LNFFGKFYDPLVYFVVIWYTIFCFGMLHQEKSGNLGPNKKIMLQVLLLPTQVPLKINTQSFSHLAAKNVYDTS
jgi:hypothetical protein